MTNRNRAGVFGFLPLLPMLFLACNDPPVVVGFQDIGCPQFGAELELKYQVKLNQRFSAQNLGEYDFRVYMGADWTSANLPFVAAAACGMVLTPLPPLDGDRASDVWSIAINGKAFVLSPTRPTRLRIEAKPRGEAESEWRRLYETTVQILPPLTGFSILESADQNGRECSFLIRRSDGFPFAPHALEFRRSDLTPPDPWRGEKFCKETRSAGILECDACVLNKAFNITPRDQLEMRLVLAGFPTCRTQASEPDSINSDLPNIMAMIAKCAASRVSCGGCGGGCGPLGTLAGKCASGSASAECCGRVNEFCGPQCCSPLVVSTCEDQNPLNSTVRENICRICGRVGDPDSHPCCKKFQ